MSNNWIRLKYPKFYLILYLDVIKILIPIKVIVVSMQGENSMTEIAIFFKSQ